MKKLKIFVCTDHEGFWPVGTASVVIAKSKDKAWNMLKDALAEHGISDTNFTLEEIPLEPGVRILCDGEY